LSLQDVEQKVMASAQQEAKQLVEEAEAEAKAELERRSASLRDEHERRVQADRAEVDRDLEREVTTRRAEHAMKILEAKNAALDAVFEQARERILASQGFDYGAWLARQVRQAVEKGEGVLHCNERDRATVEAVLRETGSDRVTMAEGHTAMAGGVLLVGPSFDLDLTLESALADLRDEMAVSLAERLFAGVPAMGDVSALLGE
jgi:vacuolar-type H+-ATPase subunit E/Vma4